jgi:hypothetical protein
VTNDKDFEEEIQKVIDMLVLKGLVEVTSIDATTGEFLYSISPDLVEAMPEIREETEKMFVEKLDDLWVKGFISMDKTSANPVVSLNEIAFDPESVKDLSFEERVTLHTVMEALKITDGD